MNIRALTSFLVSVAALSGCTGKAQNTGPAVHYLSWTFPTVPAGTSVTPPNCGADGIVKMVVTIDGTAHVADCLAGFSSTGWETPALSPGDHTLQFSAQTQSGQAEYFLDTQFSTGSSSTSQAFPLQWAVGGVSVRWHVMASSTQETSCSTAQTQYVYVQLEEASTKALIFVDPGYRVACTSIQLNVNQIPVGTYNVYAQTSAPTGGGAPYYSNQNNPAQAIIKPGVFSWDDAVFEIHMY